MKHKTEKRRKMTTLNDQDELDKPEAEFNLDEFDDSDIDAAMASVINEELKTV